MPAGEVGAGGIPDWGATLRAFVASALDYSSLQEPQESAGAAAQALARDRGDVCALWLSSSDGAPDTGEGWKIGAKRVYRLYDEENLKVRSVERKKIARRQRVPQAQASGPNQCWSADFVSDKLTDGRTIRILR